MRLEVDGRTFIVALDEHGTVASIKERKVRALGKPWSCVYDVARWSAARGSRPKYRCLTARIIEEAEARAARGMLGPRR